MRSFSNKLTSATHVSSLNAAQSRCLAPSRKPAGRRQVHMRAEQMNEQIQLDFVPGATSYNVEELTLSPSDLAMETEKLPSQQSGELRMHGRDLWIMATSSVVTPEMSLVNGDLIKMEVPPVPWYYKYRTHEHNPFDDQLSWRRKEEIPLIDGQNQWRKDMVFRLQVLRQRVRVY